MVQAPRRATLLCVVAVIGAALAGVALMRAQAAWAGSSDCASGNFCLWSGSSYSGTMWSFNTTKDGTSWNDLYGTSALSVASSAFNNRSHSTNIGEQCILGPGQCTPPGGSTDCMIPGGGRGDLVNWWWSATGDNENNSIEYYWLRTQATTC